MAAAIMLLNPQLTLEGTPSPKMGLPEQFCQTDYPGTAVRLCSSGGHVGIRSIVPFGQFDILRAGFILILNVGGVTGGFARRRLSWLQRVLRTY